MGGILETLQSTLEEHNADEHTATFTGQLSPEWCIGTVPHGGTSLSCVMTAAVHFMRLPEQQQKGVKHPDPVHVAASYISATTANTPYKIYFRLIKKGKSFSNLEGRLEQRSHEGAKPTLRLHCMIMMTNFAQREADPTAIPTVGPESPFYAPCPIPRYAQCRENTGLWPGRKFAPRKRMRLLDDSTFKKDATTKRMTLEGAIWMEIIDPNEGDGKQLEKPKSDFTGAHMGAFFADWAESPIGIMTQLGLTPKGSSFWFPTLQLSIEFKRAFDFEDPILRAGMWSRGRFVNRGLHEMESEVWSHPDDAKKLGLPEDQETTILCISRQFASTVNVAVNLAQNKSTTAAKSNL